MNCRIDWDVEGGRISKSYVRIESWGTSFLFSTGHILPLLPLLASILYYMSFTTTLHPPSPSPFIHHHHHPISTITITLHPSPLLISISMSFTITLHPPPPSPSPPPPPPPPPLASTVIVRLRLRHRPGPFEALTLGISYICLCFHCQSPKVLSSETEFREARGVAWFKRKRTNFSGNTWRRYVYV